MPKEASEQSVQDRKDELDAVQSKLKELEKRSSDAETALRSIFFSIEHWEKKMKKRLMKTGNYYGYRFE